MAGALSLVQAPTPVPVGALHGRLASQLSAEQSDALSALHPGFQVLSVCSGRFSGGTRDELVVGIRNPTGKVHRAGLLWQSSRWEIRDIDAELDRDRVITRSYPLSWAYTLTEKGFIGEMKCGSEAALRKEDRLSNLRGEHMVFDLANAGLARHTAACFASHEVYDNWDCVVFSPKDGRFRLWFQKARAD
jgi:hypothetical protein